MKKKIVSERELGEGYTREPFFIVKEKLNQLKKVLTKWSKETYVVIFHKVSTI